LPIGSQGTPRLPRVLRESTAFVLLEQNIRAEGLFRIPPHSKLRDVLKEAYDRGQKYIVWKDNDALLQLPPYPHAEHQDDIVAEIDARDAYSVFMAAALIKAWYAELRQPIFPQACYHDLKRLYGNPDDIPDLERLQELFSPTSEWSFLPAISREILVKHLLPTLSAVAAREEQNKMTAENLAVCIAPALLHGPDQLEDAKMSSIVRRIFTEAIESWSQGLREACGENEATFREALELPQSQSDWEDPLEQAKGTEEERVWDENHSTGIVLQDNEKPTETPPALPPRVGISSGRAPNETATKRKPAPPLEIPPRYSTLVTDSPTDASPITYGATTDGFAPRRDEFDPNVHFPGEKKTGTNSGDSYASQIKLPKRKTLTAEQIDNADNAIAQVHARKVSEDMEAQTRALRPSELKGSAMPLLGLAHLSIGKAGAGPSPPVKRKAVSGTHSASQGSSPTSATSTGSPSAGLPTPFNDFRRPSLPASANRTPQINTLARPVFPSNPTTNRPPSKSTSLPVPAPKPRTPSPSLLQRMPSFETSRQEQSLAPPSLPRRLNMKKQSVEDLRRLYEERAGTASVLVEAGRKH
jgi:Rho GTPase-activating protein 1